MGIGEGGQEIAELMIPANKVGLIIGSSTHIHVHTHTHTCTCTHL